MPVIRSAIPTTIPKIAVCSAMSETFRAVASAVSVTHRFRCAFETGLPLVWPPASGSFVPAGSDGSSSDAKRPISA